MDTIKKYIESKNNKILYIELLTIIFSLFFIASTIDKINENLSWNKNLNFLKEEVSLNFIKNNLINDLEELNSIKKNICYNGARLNNNENIDGKIVFISNEIESIKRRVRFLEEKRLHENTVLTTLE